ncbi:LacI family DNA-binding transcriptional regulator [Streptomyces sp. NBC_00878]|uniref:LacI family DNA-binding transcriptional regulator n=1 Tax=Streptomyces sp. NBC_00878 TaxID=2975854 RepID=UPI00225A9BE0|nr:substrate-binding domain-containing protein [Streptomyces sp. NBC_00878]MCX4905251.1 substrate-binding domain-containing protein [Streptomyces sp. NBC_00878]
MNHDATAGTGPNGRTRALGLVFPPAGDHYTPTQLEFVGRVAETAQAYDYDLLLTTGREVGDPPFQRILAGRRVNGLILMEIQLDDARATHLIELGFPFVTIGQSGLDKTWWVDMDWVALSRACVRHLADLGHQRIAFVNRSQEFFESGYESAHRGLEGFNEGVAELGLTGRGYLCGDDDTEGEACLRRILQDDPATSALVTMNEASLGGIYRGLTRAGRVVPRDFSVLGLVCGPWAAAVTPPLTAADEPIDEICRVAVELLLERLDDPGAAPRHVVLRPLISIRSSTGPGPSGPDEEF